MTSISCCLSTGMEYMAYWSGAGVYAGRPVQSPWTVFWRGPPYSLLVGVATVPWATSSLCKLEELLVAFYMAAGFFSAEMMVLGRLWWVGEDGLGEFMCFYISLLTSNHFRPGGPRMFKTS